MVYVRLIEMLLYDGIIFVTHKHDFVLLLVEINVRKAIRLLLHWSAQCLCTILKDFKWVLHL